jgi:Flp pilus assembly protein TadG
MQRNKRTYNKHRAARHGRSRHGERGQSLVEMALAVPILVLILATVIDASRIFDALIVLTNAAREGARFATLQEDPLPTEEGIKTMVVDDVVGSGTNISQMNDEDLVVVVVLTDNNEARVRVSYPFPLWFGGLLGIPQITVTREAVMPMYYPPPPTPTPSG